MLLVPVGTEKNEAPTNRGESFIANFIKKQHENT